MTVPYRWKVGYPHWYCGGPGWQGSCDGSWARLEGLNSERLRVRWRIIIRALSHAGPGNSKAIITLTMANRGPEAYKTEMYHQNVIIERTLMKSGASSYKFRAERGGRILASKRDELTQICQWFNITIDSPLTVLTQDQARSFLQNADDSTLYKVSNIRLRFYVPLIFSVLPGRNATSCIGEFLHANRANALPNPSRH